MKREHRFATIRTEGGLLPADLLARIAEGEKSLEGLDPTGYHLAPGERLNEAVSRSWNRLLGAWENFATALAEAPDSDRTTTALTRNRWSQVLFQELGYGQLQTAKAIAVDGKEYPVSHLWEAVPVHLVGARVDIDRRTSGVAGAARMSPHGLVQELLNRSDAHLWGFVSNGLRLRLLRDNVSLTRQAFVEFDLEAMLTGQAYADFVVLWLLCHQSRVEGDIPEKCLLERWSAEAAQRGTRALDQLRGAVESAIGTMGEGFLAHPANGDLRDRLRSGALDRQDYYRQLLRLVYRLLFVSVAEARDVLNDPGADPTAKERYRHFYSLERIRDLAESRRGGPHSDLWAQLQLVFRALGADAGCPELALPSLGSFLWSADATPDLDEAGLANRHLLGAVRTLSSTREGKVTRTVDYRNLGSEELGSVYESLLELHPELNVDARTFSLSTASGHERKTTGSYYTPTSLIKELLDSALDPVLAEATAAPDPEARILDLKVLDPAVGSGHFLIAAAHRIAKRLAAIRTGEDEPSPEALRSALRGVVGRCLYGIDLNPMAVELCKVSLWMEAVEPGKPLSFLDHHIVQGNSLLGATPRLLTNGIPEEAFKAPLPGDDPEVVKALRKRNAAERKSGQQVLALGVSVADLARPLAGAVAAIDALPDNTLGSVREKERRHAEFVASTERARARLGADAWCAAFVVQKTKGAPVVTDAIFRQLASSPEKAGPALIATVRQAAVRYGFCHLHLAFPDVFTIPDDGVAEHPELGWDGGFDIVLGNPPWDEVQLEEKKFFAQKAPEIAEASGDRRKKLIARLPGEDPILWSEYQAALRLSGGVAALARSGRFPLSARGKINTDALFTEVMLNAIDPGGRVGAIVPSGVATDKSSRALFAHIIDTKGLASLFEFENEGFFPGTGQGHMNRFCLLTLTGSNLRIDDPIFVFRGQTVSDLADQSRRVTLRSDDFKLLNPNTRTCPIFHSNRDAEITKAIYRRVPVLIEAKRPLNPWAVRLTTMFNMASDSSKFLTAADCERAGARLKGNVYELGSRRFVPLYEGKMINLFNHRSGDHKLLKAGTKGHVLPEVPGDLLSDPSYCVFPRYWVEDAEVDERLRGVLGRTWLFGWRDVTDARASARTLVASALPVGAVGDSLPLVHSEHAEFHLLIGCLSSFVSDFIARSKVGGLHLNFFILEQLAVLPPAAFDVPLPWDIRFSVADWLKPRLLELTYTAWDLATLAADLGWDGPPFQWEESRRSLLRAELDACFFQLYGLPRDDVDYIMDTFPIVRRKEEATFNEYRTKRVILERYDAMAEAIATGRHYQTVLDPPPAHPSAAHPARR